MTKGERAKAAKETYKEFFDSLILEYRQACDILPLLKKVVPTTDLTSFRDAFHLRVRVIGTEREKYWVVACAIYNQWIVPIHF
jgi:hypothetical protein